MYEQGRAQNAFDDFSMHLRWLTDRSGLGKSFNDGVSQILFSLDLSDDAWREGPLSFMHLCILKTLTHFKDHMRVKSKA